MFAWRRVFGLPVLADGPAKSLHGEYLTRRVSPYCRLPASFVRSALAAFLRAALVGMTLPDLARRPHTPVRNVARRRCERHSRDRIFRAGLDASLGQFRPGPGTRDGFATDVVEGRTAQRGRAGRAPVHRAHAGDDERAAPRVLSAGEAFVDDLVRRLGEKALRVEAPSSAMGQGSVLAGLDLDAQALGVEIENSGRQSTERRAASPPFPSSARVRQYCPADGGYTRFSFACASSPPTSLAVTRGSVSGISLVVGLPVSAFKTCWVASIP